MHQLVQPGWTVICCEVTKKKGIETTLATKQQVQKELKTEGKKTLCQQ